MAQSLKELLKPTEVFLKRNEARLEEILAIDYSGLSDAEITNKAKELKAGKHSAPPLEEAFALAKEAAGRSIGEYHFNTQLLAGTALFEGNIAEMLTGEGKTLAAVLPVFLHAVMGRRVHILTFNDYLAERDCNWMSPVYQMLGLTAAFITQSSSKEERIAAYKADVLYASAREVGFDYLREFLETDPDRVGLNPFEAAIVDEADSILIDEARIPLVIAGNVLYSGNVHLIAETVINELKPELDFELDKAGQSASLTDEGIKHAEELTGIDNLYDEQSFSQLEAIQDAVKAHHMLKKDVDYIVRDEKIELVDEFTGRVAEKRQYPEGLQAAVETKEGIISKNQGMILSSINLQSFASLYKHLAGMTGTAVSSAREFKDVYKLGCISIPPYKTCIRIDNEDIVFRSKPEKLAAIANEIQKANKQGRPVLIGTQTVQDSEYLASLLKDKGLKFAVLNAKNDADEAEIIAKAGMLGAITVSTNMAGRGVDIKLGGTEGTEREKLLELGGLYIIGTNRYESIRIDNQLRGRAGRQGDPGESRFFISLEDDVMERFALRELLPAGYIELLPEGGEITDSRVINEAKRIQRIAEGKAFDMREQLMRYNELIEDQRKLIFAARCKILKGEEKNSVVRDREPDLYYKICKKVSNEAAALAEKQLKLYYINTCWAEYLEYAEYIRQNVHFNVLGGKNPLDEFNRMLIEAFDEMQEDVNAGVLEAFAAHTITEEGIDMAAAGLVGPSATWTYLVNESSNQFSRFAQLLQSLRESLTTPVRPGKTLMERIGEIFKK
ncbi:MAG: accessory Sec system translocase SecA2 [Oscillospiraceae bacterium]|jgi:preprotein translocase subunit SecA|nr:accessory Sec system translocase SecA2 [Oscillospiraceae bacterium]